MTPGTLQESNPRHVPVMLSEVLEFLKIRPDGIYMDGTIGAGGHATPILNQLSSNGKLIGFDRDAEALELCYQAFSASERPFSLHNQSYDSFSEVLEQLGIAKVNGMLLDLGLSSMQLESPTRGFAFQSEGRLDMRFNPVVGKSAAELIQQSDEKILSTLFREYGEEIHSERIAKYIKRAPRMETVSDLKEAIRRCTSPNHRNRVFARIFQALRIAVNEELEKLTHFLSLFVHFLSPEGRMVILSYHSLEDRLVKHTFKRLKLEGQLKILTKKPLVPTELEQSQNRRSRSAKLRVAERSG